MKIKDPQKTQEKYENWKKSGCQIDAQEEDKPLILQYVKDMEIGRNTSGASKGGRSFARLNAIRTRIPQISRMFQKEFGKNFSQIKTDEVTELFHKLKTGEITKIDGSNYASWDDYVKDFKAFWNWNTKVNKKYKKNYLENITEDVEDEGLKPKPFVYMTIEEVQKLVDSAKLTYKTLIMFLFDSCIRAPKEMSNIKVKDLERIPGSTRYYLNIRDEISKTYGRKIKLMLCHNLLKRYIEVNNLKPDDYLFDIAPKNINLYLKRLGNRTIGKTPTMYDFRHSGICYWLPRYKNESALRYRTGHKTTKMLDYYHQFLGMKDTIQEEDLEDVDTRTKLQEELEKERKSRELLQEQQLSMQKEIEKLREFADTWKDLYKNKKLRDALNKAIRP